MPSPLKLIPLPLDVLEMFINDLPYLSPVLWGQVEAESLFQTEIVSIKPVLAFRIAFFAVHVNGFVSLICIEEKPPSEYEQDRRHLSGQLRIPFLHTHL